jgi:hypothetical protein
MAQKETLADLIAKELGYRDKKELKRRISGESGDVKTRLESGQGFAEAFGGAGKQKIQDVKKTFSKEGAKKLGKKAYMSFFGGEDIFSAYMRGRLNKGKKTSEDGLGESGMTGGADSVIPLKIIAKESMAIPGMARDVNVMRQNLQKLVKLWGGEKATSRDKSQKFFEQQKSKEDEIEASRVKPIKEIEKEKEG